MSEKINCKQCDKEFTPKANLSFTPEHCFDCWKKAKQEAGTWRSN